MSTGKSRSLSIPRYPEDSRAHGKSEVAWGPRTHGLRARRPNRHLRWRGGWGRRRQERISLSGASCFTSAGKRRRSPDGACRHLRSRRRNAGVMAGGALREDQLLRKLAATASARRHANGAGEDEPRPRRGAPLPRRICSTSTPELLPCRTTPRHAPPPPEQRGEREGRLGGRSTGTPRRRGGRREGVGGGDKRG
jgi:hypothetical protein